jgi:hypothetical protein
MKTCVVRRQFYSSDLNKTVMIQAEPGFGTPKAAICYFCVTNVDIDTLDTTTIQKGFGIGFMVGSGTTAGLVINSTQQDAVATSVTRTSNFTGLGPVYIQGAGAGNSNIWRTTACRFVNNGMLITFAAPSTGGTPPPDQTLDVITTFFTGSDLQVAKFETSAAYNVGVGITFNCGFQPDFIIGAASRANSAAGGGFSYGFVTKKAAVGSTAVDSQGCVSHHFSTGVGTMYQRMRHSRYFAEQCPVNTSPTAAQTAWECDYFTSNGVHFVVRNASKPVGAIMGGIAFQFGGKYYGTSYNTFTSIGTETQNVGFPPQILIGAACGTSSDNLLSAPRTPDSDSFTMFVGTGATTSKDRYGIGTMTVSSGSTVVTGTGTSFMSQLSEGNRIFNASGTFIGSIGAVNSDTSLTFKAGAQAAMSSSNYFIRATSQHSVVYGNEFNNTNSIAYTSATRGVDLYKAGTGAPTIWVEADFNPFNRRPSYTFNYKTVDSIPRWGWIITFQDENRRAQPTRIQ